MSDLKFTLIYSKVVQRTIQHFCPWKNCLEIVCNFRLFSVQNVSEYCWRANSNHISATSVHETNHKNPGRFIISRCTIWSWCMSKVKSRVQLSKIEAFCGSFCGTPRPESELLTAQVTFYLVPKFLLTTAGVLRAIQWPITFLLIINHRRDYKSIPSLFYLG